MDIYSDLKIILAITLLFFCGIPLTVCKSNITTPALPANNVTTSAPTLAPTLAPTPVTNKPTSSPVTNKPTSSPVTNKPTPSPATNKPTQAPPQTDAPTTLTPTMVPETPKPDEPTPESEKTPDPTISNQKSSSGMSTSTIVGITAGIVGFLLIVLAIVLMKHKRRYDNDFGNPLTSPAYRQQYTNELRGNTGLAMGGPVVTSPSSIPLPPKVKYEMDSDPQEQSSGIKFGEKNPVSGHSFPNNNNIEYPSRAVSTETDSYETPNNPISVQFSNSGDAVSRQSYEL